MYNYSGYVIVFFADKKLASFCRKEKNFFCSGYKYFYYLWSVKINKRYEGNRNGGFLYFIGAGGIVATC